MKLSKTVNHSGMDFIDDNVFHIELSPAYTQLGASIKSVEFVRAWENRLMLVEAKSSFPNPNNLKPNPDKGDKTGARLFRDEVAEICDKFMHSLNLYSAIDIGVTKHGFPPEYTSSEKVVLEFVLVINGFQKSWCDEVERALKTKLFGSVCMAKIWKPRVHVMNHEDAQKRKLITA